jgi:hypothetical protein
MTDKKKIEFRKLLAEYLIQVSLNVSTEDTMQGLIKLETWIDQYVSAEIAVIIGHNSKLKVN